MYPVCAKSQDATGSNGNPYNDGDFLAYAALEWSRTAYGKPVGTGSTTPTDQEVRITPVNCAATGAVTCAAPVLYYVELSSGQFGWLDHLPTVAATANPALFFRLALSPADIADALAHPNPLFGQDLPAGASLQLTASLADAHYGTTWKYQPATNEPAFVLTDTALIPTAQLARKVCQPNAESFGTRAVISYVNPNTGLSYAAVSDADLANNTAALSANVTRTCPQADIASVSVSAVSGVDSTVTDGENYEAFFTVGNVGAVTPAAIGLTMNTFNSNWIGFTRQVSCVSSNPGASPCPSQGSLDAALATPGQNVMDSTLAPGDQWTLRVFGNAGTTTCPGNFSTGQVQMRVIANGMGVDDSVPGNNTGLPAVNLNLSPQGCAGASFSFNINKTGPFAADGVTPVGTSGAPITVGGRAYFRLTLTNTSGSGASIANVRLTDNVSGRFASPSNTFVGSNDPSPGPFQRDPAQPAGLPLTQSVIGVPTTINSGIVCTAFGGAVCPSSLNGFDNQAGDSYYRFDADIPLLPPTSCPVGVTCNIPADPAARIELLVPYHDEPLFFGCTPPGDTSVYTNNVAQLFTTNLSTVIGPDGTVTAASGGFSGSQARIYSQPYVACPLGGVLAIDKTLLSPALAGAPGGGGTVYNGNIANGPATFQIAMNNVSGNGTGFDLVNFSDTGALFVCRDGNFSNPNSQPGVDRCGTMRVASLSCTASGGAVCPSASQMSDAVANAPANFDGFSILWGTPGVFTTIPDGGGVVFTVGFTASGVNQFTGSLVNRTDGTGYFGLNQSFQQSRATINLPFAPGIAISKAVDKLQAAAGETVTYTVDVVNGGNGALAAGAVFTDPLPAGLASFASVSCVGIPGPSFNPVVGTCPGVITNNGAGISATLPAMPANSGMRFTITAVAPTGGIVTSVNNLAQVQVPVASGGTSTLRASTNFAVPSAAEAAAGSGLLGFKSVVNLTRPGAAFALPGDSLRYTVSYFNNGAVDIASFLVADPLPASVTYAGGAGLTTSGPVTGASLNGGYNGVGNTALLLPGAVLGAGGVVVFTIPVTVNAATAPGTIILNQGSATGTGITGNVLTDNVDNTNPACGNAGVPAPCLPAGVTVPAGSVPQTQAGTIDPVAVPVVGFLVPNIIKTGTLPTPTTVQWRVTVANNLLANAGKGPMNFVVTDPVPAGMTPGAISCNVTSGGLTTVGSCALVGSTYTVTGTLNYAAAATPDVSTERIEIVLQGTLVAGTTLNNTATVTNTSAGGGTRSASASVNGPLPPGGGGGGGPPEGIPTLSQWGLMLLSLLLMVGAARRHSSHGKRLRIYEQALVVQRRGSLD